MSGPVAVARPETDARAAACEKPGFEIPVLEAVSIRGRLVLRIESSLLGEQQDSCFLVSYQAASKLQAQASSALQLSRHAVPRELR